MRWRSQNTPRCSGFSDSAGWARLVAKPATSCRSSVFDEVQESSHRVRIVWRCLDHLGAPLLICSIVTESRHNSFEKASASHCLR
jgi:hypothetical protein